MPRWLPRQVAFWQEGLAFADGADHGVGGEGKQLAERQTPEWSSGKRRFASGLEELEGLGSFRFGPVVADIEEFAALGAAGERLRDTSKVASQSGLMHC